MNSDYEKRLEIEIDRELKGLPQLPAPASLRQRVMAAVARSAAAPWYLQPWQGWPAPLRVTAMAILMASFGALCFAAWQLTSAAGLSLAFDEVGHLFSGLSAVWNVLNALAGVVVVLVKHLGTGFLIACGLAIALGYAICLSFGTACVRLALAQRR